MILNLVVLGLVALIAYLWSAQGLFSAMLHFVCALAAGAVAFAVWEPLATGVFMGVRQDMAWTLGLILPFLATLLVLRIAADKLIVGNLDFDDITNYVGGALFGLGAGVIAIGIFVISVGFMRFSPTFLGYKPIGYDGQGNLVRAEGTGMWLPADRLTAKLYEHLSLAAFSTDSPLALRQPDVHEQAGLIRTTYDGMSRTTLTAADFTVVGRYTVNAETPAQLLSDEFGVDSAGQPRAQPVKDVDGAPLPPGSRIEGYVVRFEPSAREKSGQVVVGPGQLRLVCRRNGDAFTAHPVAVIGRTAAREVSAGRFRFDAPDVFIASVGADANPVMAFEFVLPPDAQPVDLLVKNVRIPAARIAPIADAPADGFSVAQRDAAVRNMSLIGARGSAPALDASAAQRVESTTTGRGAARVAGGLVTSDRLPGALNISESSPLEVDGENKIVRGRKKFSAEMFRNGLQKDLAVDTFYTRADAPMVQIDVSVESRMSILGQSVDAAESLAAPMIVDSDGERYLAVGFIHFKDGQYEVKYDPGSPIRQMRDLPTLSRSTPGEKLTLLFHVSRGSKLIQFAIGSKVLYEFEHQMR